MKSARADALSLIFPLLLRLATVDFFGIDDFRDLVEVLLGGFDVELRDRVDDDREECEEDWLPFFAIADNRQQESNRKLFLTLRVSRAVDHLK
jgi:hypothetical protein